MWLAGLPLAATPLWQVEQAPITSTWSTLITGLNAELRWQLPQLAVLAICVSVFPLARLPLWQLLHAPMTSP